MKKNHMTVSWNVYYSKLYTKDGMKEDELPIFNWIWFGLYRSEGSKNAQTYGMDVFGKDG